MATIEDYSRIYSTAPQAAAPGFNMQDMLAAFAQMAAQKQAGRLQLQREATAPRHLDMSGNQMDTTPGAQDPWKNGFFKTNQQRMDRTREVLGTPGYEEATPEARGMAAGQTLSANPFLAPPRPLAPDTVHTDLTDSPEFGMINPPPGRPLRPGPLPPLARRNPYSFM